MWQKIVESYAHTRKQKPFILHNKMYGFFYEKVEIYIREDAQQT